jgi:cytochrome c oxidase subunit 1/cytochrome c oxidase subunit I+III
MTVSALFLMGSMAIFLLGMFNAFLAQTLPIRLPGDTPTVAMARLQYLFAGVTIFIVGALAYLPRQSEGDHQSASKLGFWFMFLGFNLAFFPTALRRTHVWLTHPMGIFSATVGPEIVLGAVLFAVGTGICIWDCAMVARSTRE